MTMPRYFWVVVRSLIFVGGVLAIGASVATGAGLPRGKVGQMPVHPTEYKSVENTDLTMMGAPTVTMTGEGKATVSFTTDVPTPAAHLYFGVYQPDEKTVVTPRFRKEAVEDIKAPATEHSLVLDANEMFAPKYDVARLKENNGGIIVYRLEVYDPERARSVFYDNRFAFRGDKRVPAIVEGPFVDMVTSTSAVISFDTDMPVTAEVLADGKTHAADKPATHFEIDLEDLTPNSEIAYSVRISVDEFKFADRPYTFRTPPKDATRFRFAVMGDSREGVGGGERNFNGSNYRTLTRFFSEAVEKGAAFVVHSGDLINGYTTSNLDFDMQLASFKDAEETIGASMPIYEVMGNHEAVIDLYWDNGKSKYGIQFDKAGEDSSESVFARHFVNPTNGPEPAVDGAPPYSENVYYVDYGNSRLVMMNNNYWYTSHAETYGGNLEGYVLDDQMAWLKKVFDEAARDESIDHVFLFAQEAMFPNGGHVEDGMWYQGGDPAKNGGIDRHYVVARRDEIWEAFVATGKAVCGNFGDEHNFNRTLIDSTVDKRFTHPAWQITSGGAGAPYYNRDKSVPWADKVHSFTTQMNYTIIDVDGEKVRLRAYGFGGEIIDDVVLTDFPKE
ncbi:MAG: metallophosphoesterase [Deltaproteobacteria bacterium]|nr:metallophosphoesterase [Deltaproteobacteria bacterium]